MKLIRRNESFFYYSHQGPGIAIWRAMKVYIFCSSSFSSCTFCCHVLHEIIIIINKGKAQQKIQKKRRFMYILDLNHAYILTYSNTYIYDIHFLYAHNSYTCHSIIVTYINTQNTKKRESDIKFIVSFIIG